LKQTASGDVQVSSPALCLAPDSDERWNSKVENLLKSPVQFDGSVGADACESSTFHITLVEAVFSGHADIWVNPRGAPSPPLGAPASALSGLMAPTQRDEFFAKLRLCIARLVDTISDRAFNRHQSFVKASFPVNENLHEFVG